MNGFSFLFITLRETKHETQGINGIYCEFIFIDKFYEFSLV